MQVSQHHATDHGVRAGYAWSVGEGFGALFTHPGDGEDDTPNAFILTVTGTDGYDARQIRIGFSPAEGVEFLSSFQEMLLKEQSRIEGDA